MVHFPFKKFKHQLEDLKIKIIHAEVWVTLLFRNDILNTITVACTVTQKYHARCIVQKLKIMSYAIERGNGLRSLRASTLSPGVELKSPATINEGVHSNLSDTNVLN